MLAAPVGDLAVHLEDLREALGLGACPESLLWQVGFDLYVRWLAARLRSRALPALRLTDGVAEWVAGDGEPLASVCADRRDLFRMISGRRSADWISLQQWDGDPSMYLDVIAPYPLPAGRRAGRDGSAP
jgi:hypothetical protein